VSIFEPFEAGGHEFAGVGCCFCGSTVHPGPIDPITLTVKARSDRPRTDGLGVQTLWCHAECLEATGAGDLHVTRPEFWEDAGSDE
jgi:hypothetical protein